MLFGRVFRVVAVLSCFCCGVSRRQDVLILFIYAFFSKAATYNSQRIHQIRVIQPITVQSANVSYGNGNGR